MKFSNKIVYIFFFSATSYIFSGKDNKKPTPKTANMLATSPTNNRNSLVANNSSQNQVVPARQGGLEIISIKPGERLSLPEYSQDQAVNLILNIVVAGGGAPSIVHNNIQMKGGDQNQLTSQEQATDVDVDVDVDVDGSDMISKINIENLKAAKTFAMHHKLLLGGFGIGTGYVALLSRIIYLRILLSSKYCWSVCWKTGLYQPDLILDSDKVLIAELIDAINTRYNIKTKSNPILNLMNFITDVDLEYSRLNSYLRWSKILTVLRINKLFFIGTTYVVEVERRIEKLDFMKKLIEKMISNSTIRSIDFEESYDDVELIRDMELLTENDEINQVEQKVGEDKVAEGV